MSDLGGKQSQAPSRKADLALGPCTGACRFRRAGMDLRSPPRPGHFARDTRDTAVRDIGDTRYTRDNC